MLNYLSQSFIIHATCALVLSIVTLGQQTLPIEVVLTAKPAAVSLKYEKTDKISVTRKYAKSHDSISGNHKKSLASYRDQVVSTLKSISYNMTLGHERDFNRVYTITVLIKVNEYGRVLKVTVLKNSGNNYFDKLVVNALIDEVLPDNAPDLVIQNGIEWTFSNGA